MQPARPWRWAAVGAIAVLTVAKALWDAATGLEVLDLWIVSRTGAELFAGGWIDVFSDDAIQVGPITLLVQGSLWELAKGTGVRLETLFSLVIQPAVVLSCLWLVGRGIPDPRRRLPAQVSVAIVLFVWEIPWNAYIFGHPTEFLIPILWVVAGRFAFRSRVGWAGVAVAVSAGLKPWGVLGIPLLLLAPDGRGRLRALAVAGAGTALLFGPFLLFGEVNTFEYRWTVEAGTGPSWVMGSGAEFNWALRLLQGALALSVGAVVSGLARARGEEVVWAPALAVIGTRLATDPIALTYYWLAPQAILLTAAGWFIGRMALLPATVLIALCGLSFFASLISAVGLGVILIAFGVVAGLYADRVDLTWLPLRRGARAG